MQEREEEIDNWQHNIDGKVDNKLADALFGRKEIATKRRGKMRDTITTGRGPNLFLPIFTISASSSYTVLCHFSNMANR